MLEARITNRGINQFISFLVSLKDWRYAENGKIRNDTLDNRGGQRGLGFDFAMIKLRVPIEFTNTVRPICLPSPDQTAEVVLNFMF